MKPALIFLPGFMCDARLFQPQFDAFRSRFDCTAPVTPYPTIAQMADAVLSKAPRRFSLAGLSMGGIVALEVIRQAPERVERLALLDTTARIDGAKNHAVRNRQIRDVLDGKLDIVMRDELKPAYLFDGSETSDLLDLCMQMAQDLGPNVFETQSLALRDRDAYNDVLGDIDVPTLVLCGAQDRLCPPKLHHEMHTGIQGSRLVMIENAGHLPTLEQPTATNAALRAWLNL